MGVIISSFNLNISPKISYGVLECDIIMWQNYMLWFCNKEFVIKRGVICTRSSVCVCVCVTEDMLNWFNTSGVKVKLLFLIHLLKMFKIIVFIVPFLGIYPQKCSSESSKTFYVLTKRNVQPEWFHVFQRNCIYS